MKNINTDIEKTLEALRDAGNAGIHSFILNQVVGTTRSAARINDLKKLGYTIASQQRVKMGNSWGAVYTLIEKPHATTTPTNLATNGQRRMFFALANELGYEPETVKERAKKKFNLDSFKNATKDQLTWLIERLIAKQQGRIFA